MRSEGGYLPGVHVPGRDGLVVAPVSSRILSAGYRKDRPVATTPGPLNTAKRQEVRIKLVATRMCDRELWLRGATFQLADRQPISAAFSCQDEELMACPVFQSCSARGKAGCRAVRFSF